MSVLFNSGRCAIPMRGRPFLYFLLVLLAFGVVRAQSLSATNQAVSSYGIMPPLPPPAPPLVLTNPPPGPVPQFPSFSSEPATEEIAAARIFQEPLIPCDSDPSSADNIAVAAALTAFANRASSDDFSALESYLDNNPESPWYNSVLFNLGWEYYTTGYYSKALAAWEEAWMWLQDESDGAPRRLADRCIGELAEMHARIGDRQRLEEIFGQITNRPVTGPATSLLSGARQALWMMQNRPGVSFRCGPLALRSICKLLRPPSDVDEIVEDSESTTNGFSLDQLAQLSRQLGLNFQAAQRQPGAPLLLPCVVHWKVGHYAAVLAQKGSRYFVVDPTFGASRWMSGEAVDGESSGYYLVRAGVLTNGWQSVASATAAAVWGRGVTASSDPNCTTEQDAMADPSCNSHGMAGYDFHLLLASLHIEDTPLLFTPPRGPPVRLTVTYNQQEANQPATFSYANFGGKWTCNWISYITDNSTNQDADVTYYAPGGGTETFTYDPTNAGFDINWRNQAALLRLSNNSYQMSFPDGSVRIFGQPDGTVGNSRNVFLTQVIDPAGYTNLLNYDSNLRLVSVTDPQAGATNLAFYYTASGGLFPVDIYKIQQVTDRYNRTAIFGYNADGSELQSITDPIGITSQFSYAPNSDFMDSLQTPYGKTAFSFGDDGNERWLEAADPQGGVSRVEFNQADDLGIPSSDPGPVVPRGIYTRNYILYGRNTFYWDKNAMAQAPGDYSKARLYHWLHNANLASAEGCLESVKQPLENRVWFNYPGQAPTDAGATIYGSQNLPSAIDRVMDDGSEQLYQYSRNSLGKITNVIDPIGIAYTCVYAANQIDLLQVRNTSHGSNELDASFTYNSHHLPLTEVDAAGQTNFYGYNAYGQITGFTNALLQATSFNYDASGRLLNIVGPTNTAVISFGYDAFDRINAVTNADGYYVTTLYDALDRPVTNTYPDGSSETLSYQNLDPSTYVDRAGRQTRFVFDSLRHLTQVTVATNWTTYLDWCTCGSIDSITDPLGRTTSWLYDIQGRVTAKQYADGSQMRYGYEKTTSRLKTFTNERNQARTYQYYENNLLNEVIYANPSVTPTVIYNYDYYGRIHAMQDGYGVTFFNYYPVTNPPATGAGRLQSVVEPTGYDTLYYGYDALGRINTKALTNSVITSGTSSLDPFTYHHTYTYDVLGRVSRDAVGGGAYTFNYYGASSRLASIVYPSVLTTTFGYYGIIGDLRLAGLTNSTGVSLLSRFNYAYNLEGQITNSVEQLSSGLRRTNTISYDSIGEVLTVATNGRPCYSYAYDLAGNRTLEQSGTNTWRASFNPLNEIQGKDQGLSSTNRIYQWDEENRLVAVTESNTTARMVYNGFGQLAYLTEYAGGSPSMYHWYVWDGDKIAEESYINTNFSAYFHWYYDYGHYESSSSYFSPSLIYTTRDGLGSVREYYSTAYLGGVLQMEFDYDPFGRKSTLINSFNYFGSQVNYATPPEYGFANLLGMPGQSLDFAENRVYDPDLGRWISRDPIGEKGGLNLYEYGNNDPEDNVDPGGLCPQPGGVLGKGQSRNVNGEIVDENGFAVKDQLNPLNPLNFQGGNAPLGFRAEQAVRCDFPAVTKSRHGSVGFKAAIKRLYLMPCQIIGQDDGKGDGHGCGLAGNQPNGNENLVVSVGGFAIFQMTTSGK